MNTLYVSFTDFWEGHDPLNNLLTNAIKDYLDSEVVIVDPKDADICFVTIYGRSHMSILSEFTNKSILWLGENKRPNTYPCRFSISFDFPSYSGKNLRFPLWLSEIDWYDTGLGVISKDECVQRLVHPGTFSEEDISDREFCITIFNNPEGTRIEALRILNTVSPVTGFGRPFGNWFPTYETYRDKLDKMSNYLFNLCPENSLHPGYYTEKCIHAKIAGCIPVYMADPYVREDFNTDSFINLYCYHDLSNLHNRITSIFQNKRLAVDILNAPLLHSSPNLDKLGFFLKYAISSIISGR